MDRLDSRVKVLVVDDCQDTAETLRYLVRRWGHEPRIASNGWAAVAIALDFHPNVIVLDIGMPGPNGLEVARRLKSIPELEMPILIAATGYDNGTIRSESHQAGFDYFLSKPFDLVFLREILYSIRNSDGRGERPRPAALSAAADQR